MERCNGILAEIAGSSEVIVGLSRLFDASEKREATVPRSVDPSEEGPTPRPLDLTQWVLIYNARMKRKATVFGALGFGLLVGYVIYTSMTLAEVSCEVCLEFRGRRECRSAAASNAVTAQSAATDLACVFLAGGMTDSIACGNTPPASVKCSRR